MNNQMPYGFIPQMPPQNPNNQQCKCTMELRRVNDRIDNLERQLRRLERRVNTLENNNYPYPRPMPISNVPNNDQLSNNYMI